MKRRILLKEMLVWKISVLVVRLCSDISKAQMSAGDHVLQRRFHSAVLFTSEGARFPWLFEEFLTCEMGGPRISPLLG